MQSTAGAITPATQGASGGRQKILYIQPGTKTFAGMERVIDTICTKLTEKYGQDFEVDVLYTTSHHNRPLRPIYNTIDHRPQTRLQLMRTFRRVVGSKNYSLVVVPQVEPAVIAMASCLGLDRKFVVHLHGNPERECSHLKARLLFYLMRKFFLKRASYVFGTSPRQLAAFRLMFPSDTPQRWVPNPVRHFDAPDGETEFENGVITFVNVGRFSHQKGQDILLQAFASLAERRADVRLKLVGHGENEQHLRNQVDALGLENLVSMEYHPDNPQEALCASDVYVSTSRWEGWSLAICEALRFGLPVIATDCEFGPSDILIDQRLGRLVETGSQAALVDAMVYYCDHLEQEGRSAAFRRAFIERYSPEFVVDVHADALRAAAR